MKNTWALVTGTVRAQAQGSYTQDPCLTYRVRYVNTFLFSNISCIAQILPAPNTYAQQLTTAIPWYNWRRAVFRVHVSTLQGPNLMGGYGMTDIAAKCTALFFYL